MAYQPMVITESSLLSLKEWLMQPYTIYGSAQTRRQSRIRHRTLTLLALSMMVICSRVGCSSASRQKQQIKSVGLSLDPGLYVSIDIYSGVMVLERSLMVLIGLILNLQALHSSMFLCNFSLKWDLNKLVFQLMASGKLSSSLKLSSLICSCRSAFFSTYWHFLHFLDSLGCIGHPLTTSVSLNELSTDSAIEWYFCSLVIPDSKRTFSAGLVGLNSWAFLPQFFMIQCDYKRTHEQQGQ